MAKFKTLKEIKQNEEANEVYIVELRDDNILEIETRSSEYNYCETCDLGSCYVREIIFFFTSGEVFTGEVENMYEYFCSEQDLMKFFLNNLETLREITRDELKALFDKESDNSIYDYLEGGDY